MSGVPTGVRIDQRGLTMELFRVKDDKNAYLIWVYTFIKMNLISTCRPPEGVHAAVASRLRQCHRQEPLGCPLYGKSFTQCPYTQHLRVLCSKRSGECHWSGKALVPYGSWFDHVRGWIHRRSYNRT